MRTQVTPMVSNYGKVLTKRYSSISKHHVNAWFMYLWLLYINMYIGVYIYNIIIYNIYIPHCINIHNHPSHGSTTEIKKVKPPHNYGPWKLEQLFVYISISGFRSWFQDLNRPAGTQGQISSHHNIEKWYRNWRCFFTQVDSSLQAQGAPVVSLGSPWPDKPLMDQPPAPPHQPRFPWAWQKRISPHQNQKTRKSAWKHGRNNVRNQQATTQELDMWHVSSSRNEAKFSRWEWWDMKQLGSCLTLQNFVPDTA